MIRRLLHSFHYAPPALVGLLACWHAAMFGLALIGAGSGSFNHSSYTHFVALPPVVVGAMFLLAACGMAFGMLRDRRRPVLWASFLLFLAWAYVFVTIPVAAAVDGVWYPTAWARYGSPLPVAWWLYYRAPRRAARQQIAVLPIVLIPLLLPAVFSVLGGIDSSHGLVAVLVAALTALGHYLASKRSSQADFDKVMGSAAAEHNRFLFGIAGDQITALSARVAALEETEKARTQWCRGNCTTFLDRP